MIRQTETKVLPLTRELAMDVATMQAWRGERPLRPQRLQMLKSKLDRGLFHSPQWAIAELGNQLYRMNGQHSSTVLAEYEPFPEGLSVTIQIFEVDDAQDLATLFAQFDNPGSSRRSREILNAHVQAESLFTDAGINELQTIVGGIAMGITGAAQCGSCNAEEKARLIRSHSEFVEWVRQFTGDAKLRFVAIVAACYTTWRKDRGRATHFWQTVRDESHPDPQDPTRMLSRFILSEVKGGAKRTGTTWDRRAVFVKCLNAWNAYWRQKRTSLRYQKDQPIPEVI